jgi:hypothetical protein
VQPATGECRSGGGWRGRGVCDHEGVERFRVQQVARPTGCATIATRKMRDARRALRAKEGRLPSPAMKTREISLFSLRPGQAILAHKC